MMNFRVITAAMINTLGAAAAGRFSVVGYQRQGVDAEEIRGNKRRVQVFFAGGEFPRSKGRLTGDVQHMLTFNVGLSVAAAARCNLGVLDDPNATTQQVATALAAAQDASYIADQQFDELSDLVYQILMDTRNFDLGLDEGVMSSRWIESMRKDDPQRNGGLVVLTGHLQYVCQTVETITGETGTLITGSAVSTVLDIIGDDVERTGVDTRGPATPGAGFNDADYPFHKEDA